MSDDAMKSRAVAVDGPTLDFSATLPTENLPARSRATGHDNNFDVMRFVMAVLVIFSHCYVCTIANGDLVEPLYRLTGARVSFGGVAVDVFFVISGFLITGSWLKSRSAGSFLKKRVLRIFPGLIVAILVSGLVIGPIFSAAPPPWKNTTAVKQVVKAAVTVDCPSYPGAFLNNPFHGGVNVSIWTIRYELACYLLVFGLGITRLLRWRSVILVAFALVAISYAAELPIRFPDWVFGRGYVAKNWARLPAFYLAGVVAYLYQEKIVIDGRLAGLCVASIFASLFFLPLFTISLIICGSYLVIWFAYQRWIGLPHFARYGDFSYGIYLYGFPLEQSVVAVARGRLSPAGLFFTATPLAVIAGIISWQLVEKRFVRTTKRPVVSRRPE